VKSYVVVAGTTPNEIDLSNGVTTGAIGEYHRILAKFGGREYWNGLTWKSSNDQVVSVNNAGVWKGLAAGTATLTATEPESKATNTVEVTVS
jgi:hypothetical protein